MSENACGCMLGRAVSRTLLEKCVFRDCLPGLMLPSLQFSVDLVRFEVFRSKILTDPLTDVIVLWVTRVPKYSKKLSKTVRASAVFGRTISLSRHTNLPERIVSEQYLFKKKLVLPTITKVVLV